MSKYRLVMIAPMMIGAFLMFQSPAYAQCSNANLCTTEECKTRQSSVHPLCDAGNRSCQSISVNDKDELEARIQNGYACLVARLRVAECFSQPDGGHVIAIEMVEGAIALCQAKYNQ